MAHDTEAMFGTLSRKNRQKWWAPVFAQLGSSRDIVRTNEPINRKEGKLAQADLEKVNGDSYERMMRTALSGQLD